jgi:hypothetical protein
MSQSKKRAAFDPYAILHVLEDSRVEFILIGALARVLQGSDEVTHGVDVTPSPRPENIERVTEALDRIGGREVPGTKEADKPNVRAFDSPAGRILCVREPAGTRGYGDLKRKARRLHVGEGLRPKVAAPGDLVRMAEALGLPDHLRAVEAMRRIVELERGLGWEL